MKIMIVSTGASPIEVSDRLKAVGHQTIPIVYQGNPESLLAAITKHKDDLGIVYIDTKKFLHDGERLLWTTIEKINEEIGVRRTHVLLFLGCAERTAIGDKEILQRNLLRYRVNMAVIGERTSSEVALFLGNMHQQFQVYIREFGRIHEPSVLPATRRGGRKLIAVVPGPARVDPPRTASTKPSVSPKAHEESIEVSTSVDARTHASSTVDTQPEPVREEAQTHHDMEAEKPTGETMTQEVSPSAFSTLFASPRMEDALIEGIRAFFAAYRDNTPKENEKVVVAQPQTPQPSVKAEAQTTAKKFELRLLSIAKPDAGNRTLEAIILNGNQMVVTKRIRLLLAATEESGQCDFSAIGNDLTSAAVGQFLTHVNSAVKDAGLKYGKRNRTIVLR